MGMSEKTPTNFRAWWDSLTPERREAQKARIGWFYKKLREDNVTIDSLPPHIQQIEEDLLRDISFEERFGISRERCREIEGKLSAVNRRENAERFEEHIKSFIDTFYSNYSPEDQASLQKYLAVSYPQHLNERRLESFRNGTIGLASTPFEKSKSKRSMTDEELLTSLKEIDEEWKVHMSKPEVVQRAERGDENLLQQLAAEWESKKGDATEN